MTADERKDIFSKEMLNIKDFERLYGVDYNTASKIIGKTVLIDAATSLEQNAII